MTGGSAIRRGALWFGLGVVPLAALLGACSSTPESSEGTTSGAGSSGGSGATGGSAVSGTGGVAAGTGGSASAGGAMAGSNGVAGSGGSVGGSGGSVMTAGSGGVGGSLAGSGGTTVDAGAGGAAGTAGAGGSTGGGAGVAGTGGTGGSAGAGGTPEFDDPEGTIPNEPQPPTVVNLPEGEWEDGMISSTLLAGYQLAQPSVLNGYLLVAGNEDFWFYDVSNPASPAQLSKFSTPNRRAGAEAESHTVSFARYGDKFYAVTIGGTGIDTWDVTNVREPRHLDQLNVPGTNYGDYTEAVWGVAWQGQHIYVGATNNGIKVVDANDPANLSIVAEVPTSQYGGVSAGPLDAIGNVLVVTTPKESGGVATLDISDPRNPTRLASFTAEKSYIGMFHRRWIFLITPLRAWDVLSNPRSIGTGSSPIGTLNHGGAEYMSFQDDYMFLGHVRADISGKPGASKINVSDPRSMKVESTIWGRMNLGGLNDDQFTIAIGNLLVIADDQAPYHGWFIAAHDTDPDTKAPIVDTVLPKDSSTAVSTKTRIGVTFSDNIELATVNAASFIVRPVGGQPLSGKYSVRMGVLNFDPDEDLAAGTTYEVVLPQGGVGDLVGNRLATEWKSTFTTN